MRDFFPSGRPLAVLTTQPLDGPLDYLAPEGGVAQGAVVIVPLGPRQVIGVVWGQAAGDYPIAKLRPVARALDVPPMKPEMQEFLTRVGAYTLTPLPAMLQMALRAPGLAEPPGNRVVYRKGSGEVCLLYTSPSPRDGATSRMPSSA